VNVSSRRYVSTLPAKSVGREREQKSDVYWNTGKVLRTHKTLLEVPPLNRSSEISSALFIRLQLSLNRKSKERGF
jgi:hypothetical protein